MTDKLTKFVPNETSMLALGAELANSCVGFEVIFLYGDLGAGKTTLVRGFIRGLGFEQSVKSPTYTLVEPYKIGKYQLFHFDFYRVNHSHELEFMGLQDYFSADSICLIEWPEIALDLLPAPDLACYIEACQGGRKITVAAHSDHGREILQRLGKK